MSLNPFVFAALALFGVSYAAGRRWTGGRRLGLVVGAVLSLPAASFALYYLHLFREPVWYVELRSWTGVEALSGLCGFLCALVERPSPKSLSTLLGGRPGLRLGLLAAFVPFAKAVLLPIQLGNRFRDAWDDGVCLQSTMATCGPCSLATVARSLGVPMGEAEAARGAYSSLTGTESWYLLRFARRRGLTARAVDGVRLGDVAAPAILGVKLGGAGHFIILLGREKGRMVLGDPLSGRTSMDEADFERLYVFTGAAMEFGRARQGAPDYAALHARLLAGQTAADLSDALPGLARNLEAARRVSADDWTDSIVRDELAGADILPAPVLAGLGIPPTISSGVAHVPAGVMHTYGYLFSQLKTAYGLKGRRWTVSRLDERLGLAPGMFSPRPPKGEFTANVTKALRGLIGGGRGGRVEETVLWRTSEGREVKGTVRTYLFPLKPLPGLEAETHLLVYELELGGRRRLVTAFPVSADFAAGLMAARPESGGTFVPRFNLYVDPSWRVLRRESRGYQSIRG